MAAVRKKHTVQTKVKVAIEAIKGETTGAQITSKYGVHLSQVNTWKKQALASIPEAFSGSRTKQATDQQALVDELYKQIGQLKVENDFLKKNHWAFQLKNEENG